MLSDFKSLRCLGKIIASGQRNSRFSCQRLGWMLSRCAKSWLPERSIGKGSRHDEGLRSGLDGATWDVLEPLIQDGWLPNLARLREQGAWGSLRSVFPPLSPVAWTGVMTGKNSGKHGIFEFVEHRT